MKMIDKQGNVVHPGVVFGSRPLSIVREDGMLEYGGNELLFTDRRFRRKISKRITAKVAEERVSNWNVRSAAGDFEWYGIAWSSEVGVFAAVSATGEVMTSYDGVVWISRTAASSNAWSSVAWSPRLHLFAAVAFSGTSDRVMTSPDGITWTAQASAADNNWKSVTWSEELALFAAVSDTGTENRVMTSSDGINWIPRTSAANNSWRSISWSPELRIFAAVAGSVTGDKCVMTSPDGINWTSRAAVSDIGWSAIAWSPELGLFAVVSTSTPDNTVMTSPDGITWTASMSGVDNPWGGIAWSPELGLFAAVSEGGIMTSADGFTWTSRTSAADNSWTDIAWSPELGVFAAVAMSGEATTKVMVSSSPAVYLPGIVPVGAIVAWHKDLSGTPALPAEFVECNGQEITDTESPLHGQHAPDLNGDLSGVPTFVRGNTTSGGDGGSVSKDVDVTGAAEGTVSASFCTGTGGSICASPVGASVSASGTIDDIQPPYIDMVYIMRIK